MTPGGQPQVTRYEGSMIGLAIGDAVGTTLEFAPPDTFNPITDMVGGGPFRLRPGQWTDDTSMVLCLAESLIEKGDFDPIDQLERYVAWYRTGYLGCTGICFDIGNTIRAALNRFEESRIPYCGSKDPLSAGNGSLMRLAPVPLFYSNDPEKAIELSGESSRTTHQAITAIDACRYLGGLIVGALQGTDKEILLSDRFSPIPNYWRDYPLVVDIEEIAHGSFKTKQPPEIKGTGYVVDTLEAVLWAFHRSSSFEEGLLKVVNLGDDADTTGAVFGQLAGAYYGIDGIPGTWVERVALNDLILSYAGRLLR